MIMDNELEKAYEFLKEQGYFYVLTINGDFPAGRPFGAVMKEGDKLYIATHDGNHAHEEMRADPHIQILAKKEGARIWLRITGLAKECKDIKMKEEMLTACPVLQNHYPSADYPHYLLFAVDVEHIEFQ